jgi:hypothetical protein
MNPTKLNLQGFTGFVCGATALFTTIWSYFRLLETKDWSYGELDILFGKRVSARKFQQILHRYPSRAAYSGSYTTPLICVASGFGRFRGTNGICGYPVADGDVVYLKHTCKGSVANLGKEIDPGYSSIMGTPLLHEHT